MARFFIESVRAGISDGGVSCGPMGGAVIAEAKVIDKAAESRVFYLALAEVEGLPNVYQAEHSLFRALVLEDESVDVNPYYVDMGEYEDIFENRDEELFPILLFLIHIAQLDWDRFDRYDDRRIGEYAELLPLDADLLEKELQGEAEEPAISENDAQAKLRELLKNNPRNLTCVEVFQDVLWQDYDKVIEMTFRVAVQCGATEYIEMYANDIDLNDEGGHSSYLYETEDARVQDLLISMGAFRSWDDYGNCLFAMETINDSILAFDDDFLSEVVHKYLEYEDISEEKAAAILAGEFDAEDEDGVETDEETIREELTLLGCEICDGELVWNPPFEAVGGFQFPEIFERLGWDVSFEGESWKFETNGVYFIPREITE